MRTAVLLALLLGIAPPRAGGPAVRVEGVVRLPEAPPARKKPTRYPGDKVPAEVRRGPAIVFLESVPGTWTPPAEPAVISQKDRQFSPLALPVLVGSRVRFPNLDDEYHNVFSRSKAKELELGRYGTGEDREVHFDRPGLVKLRCEIHSNMHAVVAVLGNPFFATCDAEGRFEIRGELPAGRYRLCVYQENYEPKEKPEDPLKAAVREIEVPASGAAKVEIDLR